MKLACLPLRLKSIHRARQPARHAGEPLDSFARTPAPRASQAAEQACQGPQNGHHGMLFLSPNEMRPITMKPLTTAAMHGLYVGVGTERCWMAAALNPHFSALYMVDVDGFATHYNTINTALLRAANGDRGRYLHLRLHATAQQWADAAADLPEHQARLLQQGATHTWWREQMHMPSMRPFHAAGSFAGANYLHDDSLFRQVSQHALHDTVHIGRADLRLPDDIKKLTHQLRQAPQPVSVLDVSNAWMRDYLRPAGLRQLVQGMKPVLRAQSLVLATTDHSAGFYYFGLRPLTMLRRWPAAERYLWYLDQCPPKSTDINGIDLYRRA